MSTRTISTSPPVRSCVVCERRLLRGERDELFVHAGQRLMVCELCAPRAVAEGWVRERDHVSEASARPRQRPARGLLARLRGVAGGRGEIDGDVEAHGDEAIATAHEEIASSPYEETRERPREPIVPLDRESLESRDAHSLEPRYEHEGAFGRVPAALDEPPRELSAEEARARHAPEHAALLEQAVAVFNDSEFPRRMAGIARSLGVPSASVRVAEHLATAVRIVVAWELCWYRYEVDFSEHPAIMRALEQGTALEQLGPDERVANAVFAESGALVLAEGA